MILFTLFLAPGGALAQDSVPVYEGRLRKVGPAVMDSRTALAVSATGLSVSKTAFVDGQDVCGTIRITNNSGSPATIDDPRDLLEVHFPSGVSPAGLSPGSTPNWFIVAAVPVAFPGQVEAGQTVALDYCFPLCSTADYTGANSMRNVVIIEFLFLTRPRQQVVVVTTRSDSFEPPTLDCQACCLPDGSCTDTVPDDCAAASGLAQGAATDCASTECTQACCLGGSCTDETLSACEAGGGAPLGLGTDCATANTTCRGACCAGLGCVDDISEDECGDPPLEGTYLGNDSTCASELAACPTGACCVVATCRDTLTVSGTTFNLSQLGCASTFDGNYLGDGTTCATANTTCRGACCRSEGCEEDVSEFDCAQVSGQASGTFLGFDTTCAGEFSACPTGACCTSDTCRDDILIGLGSSVLVNRFGCEDVLGETYLGDGSTCAPDSCTEACCFGTTCEELLPGDCTAQGGDPQGPGTDCGILGLNPCSGIIDP
jgi:hypothetical protein